MKISYYIIFITLFLSINTYAAGTLDIGVMGDSKMCEDASLLKPLPKGCLVQVILDRDGDGLDQINLSGSIYPAGDDILMPVLSGASACMIGDGLPPFADDGQFSLILTFDNEDPTPNYTGYKIYIRFWNSPNPTVGSIYGEAGPFILEEGLKPQKIEIGSLYTDKILQK